MHESLKLLMPRVRILEAAWKRLMAYILACPTEVGGLGAVEEREGELVVTDVFLIDQVATGDDFELDPGAQAAFINDWIRRGRDVSELKFWWHSHVDMDTFWSVVDENTMRRLAGDAYVVSLVGNRRREHRTCLTVMKPVRIVVDNIVIDVIEALDQDLLDAAREEIGDKVKRKRRWRNKSAGKADRSQFVDAEQGEGASNLLSRWRQP